MSWLVRLNKPWLHFMVLGVVLFLLQVAFFPEPKTVIGPLSEARISALASQWSTSTGRQPTPEQIAGFIAIELDRDMLLQRALERDYHLYDTIIYQRLIRNMKFLQLANAETEGELFAEAIKMRLHLDDQVVKRRLVQLMEQQLLIDSPAAKPSVDEIKVAFINRKQDLQRPPLYSIEHLFFTQDRAPEVAAIIKRITDRQLDAESARQLGSPFIQGHQFARQTPDQLAGNFGKGFVIGLERARRNSESLTAGPRWLGPISSAYGLHYVWLTAFEPVRDAALPEVEQQLRQDLEYAAKDLALRCAIAALRQQYDVKRPIQKGQDDQQPDVKDGNKCR